MQTLVIEGYLAADPSILSAQGSGRKRASFRVLETTRYRRADGEPGERTTGFNCVCFNEATAENYIAPYARKGSQRDPELLERQLRHLSVTPEQLRHLDDKLMSKKEWLGAAEKTVYEALKSCAPFVSPFSIRNPDGWRYWMLHLANNYRARQVYNNILHDNGELDHFGRSGLRMFNYNPANEGRLYLFKDDDRAAARNQLHSDIPKLVMEAGDVMPMSDFYESAYSATPAHKDDIHSAMLENEDLEVLTPDGGVRRKGNTISVEDTLRLKRQRSFFPMFATKPKL